MNVFVINAGQVFAHSGGRFNQMLTTWTTDFLADHDMQYRVTNINDAFEALDEVENFKWADVVVYHTPVWWFQVPNLFKKYIDEVFTAGHQNGIYANDGRSRKNPGVNYGTGGLMKGKKYMVTTTWNAPDTAFTLPGEFFDERSVDEGVLFGFHKMNQFAGMDRIPGIHFHDLEKNGTAERIENYRKRYREHLNDVLTGKETVPAAQKD